MDIKIEEQKNSSIKLTIEIEPKELAKYFRESYEKLAPEVKVSGFRPGKAPYKMVESALGYNRLYSEGLELAVQKSYMEAISVKKIFPVASPQITVKKSPQFSLDETEIKDNLIFEAVLDIMPKVELNDWTKIKFKAPERKATTEADVEKIIKYLLRQKALFKDVKRGAKIGDRIEITYDGSVKRVRIDKMCSKNHPMILGEGNLIPGFEEKIVGMKKAEKKSFEIKFPKDYHDKDVAGKEANFELTLVELKEVVLPTLDDEFAKNYGHNKAEDLKKAIKESLEKENENNYQSKLQNEVLEKVLPSLKVIVPESLIAEETGRIIEGMKKQVESNGLNFEKYLENIKKSYDDLRSDLKNQAEKNIKVGFLLGKIIEERKIDPKDKDAGKKAVDYLVSKLTK